VLIVQNYNLIFSIRPAFSTAEPILVFIEHAIQPSTCSEKWTLTPPWFVIVAGRSRSVEYQAHVIVITLSPYPKLTDRERGSWGRSAVAGRKGEGGMEEQGEH